MEMGGDQFEATAGGLFGKWVDVFTGDKKMGSIQTSGWREGFEDCCIQEWIAVRISRK